MRIEVTPDDVEQGSHHCHQCPVARALRRAFGVDRAFAGEVALAAAGRDYRTPADVREWMQRFDSGQQVEPFSFELPD